MSRVLGPFLALAIALAGCQSDDEPDRFQEGYDAAVMRLSEIQSEISQDGDQSNREIAADFSRTADVWERTRRDLSRLDPPEQARAEFRELLDALEGGWRTCVRRRERPGRTTPRRSRRRGTPWRRAARRSTTRTGR
jgi:hypothetical protein